MTLWGMTLWGMTLWGMTLWGMTLWGSRCKVGPGQPAVCLQGIDVRMGPVLGDSTGCDTAWRRSSSYGTSHSRAGGCR